MLVAFSQQSDKLLFAGMAGGKCVTMACNNRNTIGGCPVSLPFANRFLTHWRGSALKPPLCKGRWHGEAVTEGLLQIKVTITPEFMQIRNFSHTIPQSKIKDF